MSSSLVPQLPCTLSSSPSTPRPRESQVGDKKAGGGTSPTPHDNASTQALVKSMCADIHRLADALNCALNKVYEDDDAPSQPLADLHAAGLTFLDAASTYLRATDKEAGRKAARTATATEEARKVEEEGLDSSFSVLAQGTPASAEVKALANETQDFEHDVRVALATKMPDDNPAAMAVLPTGDVGQVAPLSSENVIWEEADMFQHADPEAHEFDTGIVKTAAQTPYVTFKGEGQDRVERIKSKGLITEENMALFTMTHQPMKRIPRNAASEAQFKMEGKATWLINLGVRYPDETNSVDMYLDHLALDAIHHSSKMDFIYFGVPKRVVEKAVASTRGINVDYSGQEKDGYIWMTTTIAQIEKVAFCGKRIVQIPADEAISKLRGDRMNPLGLGVVTLRLKCTCSDTLEKGDVAPQTWSVGGTLRSLYIYEFTTAAAKLQFGRKVRTEVNLPDELPRVAADEQLGAFIEAQGLGYSFDENPVVG